MNTQHLEYIIEIYKSGSLNKAAKNCFISQSYLRGCVFDALRSGQYITAMISVPGEDARRNLLVCRPIGDLEEKMSTLLLKAKSHILSHRESEFINFLRKRLESYCWEGA